mgnify:CR=1 FL=1
MKKNVECEELHCRNIAPTHDYGSMDSSWVLCEGTPTHPHYEYMYPNEPDEGGCPECHGESTNS